MGLTLKHKCLDSCIEENNGNESLEEEIALIMGHETRKGSIQILCTCTPGSTDFGSSMLSLLIW